MNSKIEISADIATVTTGDMRTACKPTLESACEQIAMLQTALIDSRAAVQAEHEVCDRISRYRIALLEGRAATIRRLWAELAAARQAAEAAEKRANLLNVAVRLMIGMCDKALNHWDRDEDSKVGKVLRAMAGNLSGYCPDTDIIHSNIVKADALSVREA